jgi:hypothetical protein
MLISKQAEEYAGGKGIEGASKCDDLPGYFKVLGEVVGVDNGDSAIRQSLLVALIIIRELRPSLVGR